MSLGFFSSSYRHLFVIGLQQRAAGKKVQYVLPSGTLASSWWLIIKDASWKTHHFDYWSIFCRMFILLEGFWIFFFALFRNSTDYLGGIMPRTVSLKTGLWEYVVHVLCNEEEPASSNFFGLLVHLLLAETCCKIQGIFATCSVLIVYTWYNLSWGQAHLAFNGSKKERNVCQLTHFLECPIANSQLSQFETRTSQKLWWKALIAQGFGKGFPLEKAVVSVSCIAEELLFCGSHRWHSRSLAGSKNSGSLQQLKPSVTALHDSGWFEGFGFVCNLSKRRVHRSFSTSLAVSFGDSSSVLFGCQKCLATSCNFPIGRSMNQRSVPLSVSLLKPFGHPFLPISSSKSSFAVFCDEAWLTTPELRSGRPSERPARQTCQEVKGCSFQIHQARLRSYNFCN